MRSDRAYRWSNTSVKKYVGYFRLFVKLLVSSVFNQKVKEKHYFSRKYQHFKIFGMFFYIFKIINFNVSR